MAAYKAMGDEKEEGCMGAVCSGLGTAWYYGFSYGVLSTLIVMMLVWALGGFGGEKGHAMVATDDLGEGVVRGGYRWPTKPMVEPVSRTEFPPEAKHVTTDLNMLVGVAIRLKKVVGVNFKVYAVGFYVDPAGARRALSQYQGSSVSDLRNNQAFYDVLTKGNSFRRVLELNFLRSVGKEKLRDTFNEGLVIRMRKITGMRGDSLVESFISVFTDIKAGQKLIFAVDKGVLTVKLHNNPLAKFNSPELAFSLFDLYFGASPTVGDEVKKHLIERIPTLWMK
ncbi:hypothetical protein AAMO2058_000266400 [Amorphochlora amoebiformis]|mmetsp:Transcript_6279/g.9617  ORF Transcript_6279/g.9617 Transcript_6279/m.9617 type:complete len:281 (-) Transcript_6279:177-1019(-)